MKKVAVFILGIILLSSFKSSVLAESITYQRLDNIYYNLTVDGVTTSNHVTKFFLDSRLAYCIEPGAPINTKTYNSSPNWNGINLTEEQKQQIEKIGYYGFEYPNHGTDKYYIATQELIWKVIKNVDIKWTNSSGQVIDITNEKNEIQSLVKSHSTVPSFTSETLTGIVGTKEVLTDTNNVLENFNLSKTNYHSVKKEGNQITIDYSQIPKEEIITMTRKNYDTKTLLIYQYPGSQSLAALRLNYTESLNFTIKSVETPKEIVKVPNTASDEKIVHYGIYKFKPTNDGKFS